MRRSSSLFVLFIDLLLTAVPLFAQDVSLPADSSSDDVINVRFAYLIVDGPELSTTNNGQLVRLCDDVLMISPLFVTEYVTMPAVSTGIGFRSASPLVDTASLNVTLADPQPRHAYTVLMMGSFTEGDTFARVVDETTLLADVDFETDTAVLAVHNLSGAGPLVFTANGVTPQSFTLDYGAYTLVNRPLEPGSYRLTVTQAANPDLEPVFDLPGFVDIDGVYTLFALTGTYPGILRQDYGFVAVPSFMRELEVVDAGAIAADATLDLALQVGQRHAFTLTLDAQTTLDVLLVGVNLATSDAYLRIYDADGVLVVENDELDFADMGRDAGLTAIVLDAGTYTIEAASWRDVYAGDYTLVVTPVTGE